MKVVVSRRAKQDLVEIYRYISRDNPHAALNILERIDSRLTQLSRFPFIGRERSTLGPGVRSLLAGSYSVFTQLGLRKLRSCGVIDRRMDIEQEFQR